MTNPINTNNDTEKNNRVSYELRSGSTKSKAQHLLLHDETGPSTIVSARDDDDNTDRASSKSHRGGNDDNDGNDGKTGEKEDCNVDAHGTTRNHGKGRRRRRDIGDGSHDLKYFTIDDGDSEEDEEERKQGDDGNAFDGKEDADVADGNGGNPREEEHSGLWEKCFHCFCPFLVIIRALIRCDMDTFWKIIPPILVTKALYSSIITLGLCTLFKVQRRTVTTTSPLLTYHTETYFFGLYTYTAEVQYGSTFESEVKMEVHRVQTCRFDMRKVDEEAPDRLFNQDASFSVARGFAVASASLGCLSTVGVFLLTVADCRRRCFGTTGMCGEVLWRRRVRWGLAGMLLACGVFEGFAFLVLGSSVCRDGDTFDYEDRHCALEEGAGIIFSSCICWWFTAVATLKMQISNDRNDEDEGGDIEIATGGNIPNLGKKRRTGKHKGSFVVPTNDSDENVTII